MTDQRATELYRRERIAYEQMRRHQDNPNPRQFQMWLSRYHRVLNEINAAMRAPSGGA